MPPRHPEDEISTKTMVRECLSALGNDKKEYHPTPAPCQKEHCFFEQEKKDKTFFNSELLKILGVVYAIGSPLVIWLVVSMFNAQSDLKLIQAKQEVIMEIRADIKDIQNDVMAIKLQLASHNKEVK